jgi:hypothetical protein
LLLAKKLAAYLPGLQVPDLYRHTSLAALADVWASKGTATAVVPASTPTKHVAGMGQGAMVLGTGCRLPGGVHHADQLWAALEGEYCAIDDKVGEARIAFDHVQEGKRLGLSPAELKATDPQQVHTPFTHTTLILLATHSILTSLTMPTSLTVFIPLALRCWRWLSWTPCGAS